VLPPGDVRSCAHGAGGADQEVPAGLRRAARHSESVPERASGGRQPPVFCRREQGSVPERASGGRQPPVFCRREQGADAPRSPGFGKGAREVGGETTLPGLEPGPSTDGVSPDGQGGQSFGSGTTGARNNLALTKPPASHCRYEAGRRADYVPACKGSVDLCLPGHALARNWRQASFACSPPAYQGSTHPREAARRACVHSPHRDSGIATGCQVVRCPEHGHSPARAPRVRSWDAASSFRAAECTERSECGKGPWRPQRRRHRAHQREIALTAGAREGPRAEGRGPRAEGRGPRGRTRFG
jgi:hypothetical protein